MFHFFLQTFLNKWTVLSRNHANDYIYILKQKNFSLNLNPKVTVFIIHESLKIYFFFNYLL